MKKKILLLFAVLLCVCLMQPFHIFASEEEVIKNDETGIPDKELYRSILENLFKKEEETFTRAEAETLDWLDARDRKIKSLKGIGYLNNLRQLNLDRCGSLKKLDGIEELSKLVSLGLSEGVLIRDYSILASVSTLRWLDVSYNNLTEWKGIEKIVQLNTLIAYENKLKNVNPIKNLTNLFALDLDDNRLTSIKGLKNMKNLRELHLNRNNLKKLEGIKNFKNLETLTVSNNQLTNLNDIRYLKKLDRLDISGNKLKTLPNLKEHSKLKSLYLNLSGNYLTEKEMKKKLPTKIWKKKKWRQDSINFQKLNTEVTLSEPSSFKKITQNTTKISGSVAHLPGYQKATYIQLYNPGNSLYRHNRWKVGADGRFEINNLNLKKWAGKTVSMHVMIYSRERKEWIIANNIYFKVKKN